MTPTSTVAFGDCLDAYVAGGDDASRFRLELFRAAVRAAAGIAPGLPAGAQYVEELRRADAQREREVDASRTREPNLETP